MILSSKPQSIEFLRQSWPSWFLTSIEQVGDRVAIVEGETGREITFAQLKQHVHSLAVGLHAQGVGEGDVIALYASNSPEYIITFQACLLAGAVVTTANPQYTAAELGHQLSHCGARWLFVDLESIEKAEVAVGSSSIEKIYLLDATMSDDSDAPLSVGSLMTQYATQQREFPNIDPDSTLAVMPYSSGTTGLPKGVMLSHTNLLVNCLQIDAQTDITNPKAGDVLLGVLPLFHIFGMTVNMNTGLGFGATLITLRRFDPVQFLSCIEKHRVNIAYVVPPIVLFMGSNPMVEDFDISSLNYMMSGAAPLSKEQVIPISKKINCAIHQGYGLTEASPVTHREPDLAMESTDGSVGVLIPGTQAKIIDVDTGEPVTTDVPGELLVRGPQVMMGYFNDAEASSSTIDSEGWLHTGDIATVDSNGYFYIVDRLKELIKYKGYQVAPAELEGILLTQEKYPVRWWYCLRGLRPLTPWLTQLHRGSKSVLHRSKKFAKYDLSSRSPNHLPVKFYADCFEKSNASSRENYAHENRL